MQLQRFKIMHVEQIDVVADEMTRTVHQHVPTVEAMSVVIMAKFLLSTTLTILMMQST